MKKITVYSLALATLLLTTGCTQHPQVHETATTAHETHGTHHEKHWGY